MNKIKKDMIVFLLACIPSRISLTLLAKYINTDLLPYIGYITLIPAFGFIYLFFFGNKNTNLAGQNVWWHNKRIIHGLLYLLFSIYAISKNKNSYLFIAIDTFLGLILFINYHYIHNHFDLFINKNI